ncbi:MAG: hypothetical protein RL220_1183, partial [Bacteroidota bacterium]
KPDYMNSKPMSLQQHEQISAVMNNLTQIRYRISRMKSMFPDYCAHLEEQYAATISDARKFNMLPPWM